MKGQLDRAGAVVLVQHVLELHQMLAHGRARLQPDDRIFGVLFHGPVQGIDGLGNDLCPPFPLLDGAQHHQWFITAEQFGALGKGIGKDNDLYGCTHILEDGKGHPVPFFGFMLLVILDETGDPNDLAIAPVIQGRYFRICDQLNIITHPFQGMAGEEKAYGLFFIGQFFQFRPLLNIRKL